MGQKKDLIICVSAGHKSALTVLVWPYQDKPGKISVFRDSPSASSWLQAEITFRNVKNIFLVMCRGGGPTTRKDALYLAVDDVVVSSGQCDK